MLSTGIWVGAAHLSYWRHSQRTCQPRPANKHSTPLLSRSVEVSRALRAGREVTQSVQQSTGSRQSCAEEDQTRGRRCCSRARVREAATASCLEHAHTTMALLLNGLISMSDRPSRSR